MSDIATVYFVDSWTVAGGKRLVGDHRSDRRSASGNGRTDSLPSPSRNRDSLDCGFFVSGRSGTNVGAGSSTRAMRVTGRRRGVGMAAGPSTTARTDAIASGESSAGRMDASGATSGLEESIV